MNRLFPYGTKLQPVRACLQRLHETEVIDLPRLLACPFAPDGLKAAAVLEQPREIADRKRDLASAIEYEMSRYGCVLLAVNPYSQPKARKVAA